MPASQSGFGSFFLERNVGMAAGYHIPLLGCAPGAQQQQQAQHLAAMAAGLPIAYSGLQGYNFIPYPQHRHIAHMNGGFDLKAASPYHHHHHALLARGGAFYPPYRPGAAEDPGRVAKVTTRESTGALKAWLNEHLKNPYPTKGEKIMLAIITKMSLTQVSTWFANARRRLKKENRVSWASKGKSDEEDEEQEADSDEELEEEEEEEEDGGALQKCALDAHSDAEAQAERAELEERAGSAAEMEMESCAPADARLERPPQQQQQQQLVKDAEKSESEKKPSALERKENCQKPKIWSLAETATSEPARKPVDNIYHSAGKLWADWAARNGLFVPAGYTTHEIL